MISRSLSLFKQPSVSTDYDGNWNDSLSLELLFLSFDRQVACVRGWWVIRCRATVCSEIRSIQHREWNRTEKVASLTISPLLFHRRLISWRFISYKRVDGGREGGREGACFVESLRHRGTYNQQPTPFYFQRWWFTSVQKRKPFSTHSDPLF